VLVVEVDLAEPSYAPQVSNRCRVVSANTAILFLATSLCVTAQQLPGVAVLATGGTIAGRHDPVKGGYTPALSGEELISALPSIRKFAHIQVEQISNIPSQDMNPGIWVQLATTVNRLLAKPDVVGVVVTHGTNTLEETAYFLDLTTTSDKPVVLVGAQRPASDADSDGPRNLLDAIRVAVDREAVGKGVTVVMNGLWFA
jgi:L-asparaginase